MRAKLYTLYIIQSVVKEMKLEYTHYPRERFSVWSTTANANAFGVERG